MGKNIVCHTMIKDKSQATDISNKLISGEPVLVPQALNHLEQKLLQENRFNLLASEMISLNRSLPDYRYSECKLKVYPERLPTTSIVIIFHNEPKSLLFRSLWSIINRTPRELIKEIILVDDVSTYGYVKDELPKFIKTLPVQITLIRTTKREGLIRARRLGAEKAKVF